MKRKLPAAVELGRRGGKARAKKLSKKRASEIGRKAAAARWRQRRKTTIAHGTRRPQPGRGIIAGMGKREMIQVTPDFRRAARPEAAVDRDGNIVLMTLCEELVADRWEPFYSTEPVIWPEGKAQ